MFKCKKQKYRFMVVVVVVFNRKDGSLKLKIKCFIIWNEDMECTFFCFLGISWARPPTFIICPLWHIFKNESFSNWLQDMNCPIFVGQFKEKWWVFLHRKAHCVTIFSYDQFQLISLFINDFSIMTNTDVDRAKVCLSIILLQKCKKKKKKCRWSAFTSKYIAQKKWRGNSMCH